MPASSCDCLQVVLEVKGTLTDCEVWPKDTVIESRQMTYTCHPSSLAQALEPHQTHITFLQRKVHAGQVLDKHNVTWQGGLCDAAARQHAV